MDDPVDRWKNRRRMAWLAFIGGMVFPGLMAWKPEVEPVIAEYYTFATLVVLAYIGGVVVDDKLQK